jgi:hypothetical protein
MDSAGQQTWAASCSRSSLKSKMNSNGIWRHGTLTPNHIPHCSESLPKSRPPIRTVQTPQSALGRKKARCTLAVALALGIGGGSALIMCRYDPLRIQVSRTSRWTDRILKAVCWVIARTEKYLPTHAHNLRLCEVDFTSLEDNTLVSFVRCPAERRSALCQCT